MRNHTIPSALLRALASFGRGGSPAGAARSKPAPQVPSPDPVAPPAPLQASGPYTWLSALFGSGGSVTGIVQPLPRVFAPPRVSEH